MAAGAAGEPWPLDVPAASNITAKGAAALQTNTSKNPADFTNLDSLLVPSVVHRSEA